MFVGLHFGGLYLEHRGSHEEDANEHVRSAYRGQEEFRALGALASDLIREGKGKGWEGKIVFSE